MSIVKVNVKIPNPTEGLIRSAAISEAVAPQNSMQDIVNFHCDSMGVLTGRPGLSDYTGGFPTTGVIISLGTLVNNPSNLHRLVAQIGLVLYAWNGSSWTSIKTFVNSGKARFTQFIKLLYIINGSGNDTISTYDGSAVGSTNIGTLTKGDYIASYQGRVWLADKSTDRVYYTDIVDPSGNIPTVGGVQYISTLSPQDGQSITALVVVPRALLVFKQNEIFRVYSPTNIDPYPSYYVGTFSQESCVNAIDGLYFHHPTGFYKFNYNGQPQKISQRIVDFLDNVARENYDNVFGWSDMDHVYWYIFDVIIKGRLYKNVTCRYTISTQVWTIYSYGVTMNCSVLYDDGSDLINIGGVSTGVTAGINIGTDDLNLPIFCEATSRYMSFQETFANLQSIKGATVIHQNCAGMKVDFQYDKEDVKFDSSPTNILALKDDYADVFPNLGTKSFNRFRYRISGSYKGETIPVFETVEMTQVVIEGYKKN